MADVTIVPLSEENVQLFSQTAAKILPEAWSFETYKKQLSNPDDISFLALSNGEAAGFISVWPFFPGSGGNCFHRFSGQ